MLVYISDGSRNIKYIIDYYKSVIWNTKYMDIGEFELYIPLIDNNFLNNIHIGDLVWLDTDISDTRIITNIKINYNLQDGYMITVSGKDFLTVLSRRIQWNQLNLYHENIYNFLNQTYIYNFGEYADNNRRMEIVQDLDYYYNDAMELVDKYITAQYQGENIFDIVKSTLDNIGYSVIIQYNSHTNKYYYRVFRGKDRTSNQSERNKVVFSTSLGNLLEYEISIDNSNYKNTALILGEGEGNARLSENVGNNNTGFDRFEIYVNASELSQNNTSGVDVITETEYKKMLAKNGEDYLNNYKKEFRFDCKVYPNSYKFKNDYFVGDTIEVITDFKFNNSNIVFGKIKEVTESWNDTGYECLPVIEFS